MKVLLESLSFELSSNAFTLVCAFDCTMSIPEYFEGQTVFLTGSTGSVGSVFLEKLLRSCKGVKKIYVLVRPRNGVSSADRVCSLLQLPLFADVDKSDFGKVEAVSGDVTLEDMGISKEVLQRLISEVTIVFHAAARVFFNATLKSAVLSNLIGTKRILDLCHQMLKLESLIYVSTAYSNCTIQETRERLYPIDCSPEEVINMVETFPDEALEKITKRLLGQHPNTYTFSKQLAEHLVTEGRGHVKLAIVRPSIVLGTWREPFPGWLDASTGATGFIAGAGAGCFRTSQVVPYKVADLVPTDILVNVMLAAAWNLAQPQSETFQIYHVTSGLRNPITWGQYTEYIDEAISEYPMRRILWYPRAKARGSKWRNDFVVRLFQLWPSYLLDALRNALSSKRQESLVAIQQKFIRGMKHTRFFCTRQWRFHDTNTRALQEKLLPEDQEAFDMSIARVEWRSHLTNCVKGIRQHFHKDPPQTLERARKNLQRWKMIHFGAHVAAFLWIAYVAFLALGDALAALITSALVVGFIIWV
ncbi:putative fatty acyl-CoA reductase CG5065 [Neocloeon triangulifer]|uniref:putative fatty acyl-CoA reductase CG5065 n=1 Tax=Neocloeon triangulifer TaxID=2078957 RepID=UPI00286F10DF|nr:putative fatty acyl-CoA reductase CG5065 [Neocloeon triangulifer]